MSFVHGPVRGGVGVEVIIEENGTEFHAVIVVADGDGAVGGGAENVAGSRSDGEDDGFVCLDRGVVDGSDRHESGVRAGWDLDAGAGVLVIGSDLSRTGKSEVHG